MQESPTCSNKKSKVIKKLIQCWKIQCQNSLICKNYRHQKLAIMWVCLLIPRELTRWSNSHLALKDQRIPGCFHPKCWAVKQILLIHQVEHFEAHPRILWDEEMHFHQLMSKVDKEELSTSAIGYTRARSSNLRSIWNISNVSQVWKILAPEIK